MLRTGTALFLMAMVGGSVAARGAGSPAAAPASGGFYTQAQARRGMGPFLRTCSACHGEQFNGAESGPPLTGDEFLGRWRGKPIAILFDKIRSTMPPLPDRPGKLGDQTNLDIIATILSMNGVPAGPHELTPQAAGLQSIAIR